MILNKPMGAPPPQTKTSNKGRSLSTIYAKKGQVAKFIVLDFAYYQDKGYLKTQSYMHNGVEIPNAMPAPLQMMAHKIYTGPPGEKYSSKYDMYFSCREKDNCPLCKAQSEASKQAFKANKDAKDKGSKVVSRTKISFSRAYTFFSVLDCTDPTNCYTRVLTYPQTTRDGQNPQHAYMIKVLERATLEGKSWRGMKMELNGMSSPAQLAFERDPIHGAWGGWAKPDEEFKTYDPKTKEVGMVPFSRIMPITFSYSIPELSELELEALAVKYSGLSSDRDDNAKPMSRGDDREIPQESPLHTDDDEGDEPLF